MNQIEKYCDRELAQLKELCLDSNFKNTYLYWLNPLLEDIFTIALVEINRELDERKIRKEGRNG